MNKENMKKKKTDATTEKNAIYGMLKNATENATKNAVFASKRLVPQGMRGGGDFLW